MQPGNLPHWECPGATYFVTFRQADCIPNEERYKWNLIKKKWIQNNPKPWDIETERRYHCTISKHMETILDAGYGSCLMASEPGQIIVRDTLAFFNHVRYHLDSFVVMPNHVHVLFKPINEYSLSEILHSWKSFSSNKMAKTCKSPNPLWLRESWDTIIRDKCHLLRARRYIFNNPEKGHLRNGQFALYCWIHD
jgi:REP element-mobilizing transposase RayT